MPHSLTLLELVQLLENSNINRPTRHLWLYQALIWIRGNKLSAQDAASRFSLLVDTLLARPQTSKTFNELWSKIRNDVDPIPLLAGLGFAPRTSFFSALAQRLRLRYLPITPDTSDWESLFQFLRPTPFDVSWLQLIDEQTLKRLSILALDSGNGHEKLKQTVIEALSCCVEQICATGYATEIRNRMTDPQANTTAFRELSNILQSFKLLLLQKSSSLDERILHGSTLKNQMDKCEGAARMVYEHLQENGISVGIVFRLQQMKLRITRAKLLVDFLLTDNSINGFLKILIHLTHCADRSLSIRELFASNTQLLAEKIAERSAENGDHYIARDRTAYLQMLRNALGGGFIIGFTTWAKFGMYGLALSPFWLGGAAGVNYAVSFVFIMLLGWTVATKQPAFTAPALAAKLKNIESNADIELFINEITYLIRSQIAAIIGNLSAVIPTVVLICWGLAAFHFSSMIDNKGANHVLSDMHPLGPTAIYAAFTGILLFLSGTVGGWIENTFILHKLDTAIKYHPGLNHWLGKSKSAAISDFMKKNISGLASNISLGFLLGLVPVFALFFGLDLQVRHITLSAGQVAAAVFTLGISAFYSYDFWLAVAGLFLIAILNLGVSFYLAFRVALAAHGIQNNGRENIKNGLFKRIRSSPLSFFLPRT